MSIWKPMICSWYVHVGFNKIFISSTNTTRSTMANATAPWRHITIPMSHPLTHTQQQAYPVIYVAWFVRLMLETIEIIAFLWNVNPFYFESCHFWRPHPELSSPFPTIYCLYTVFDYIYDWLLYVSLGEVIIQGQQCRLRQMSKSWRQEHFALKVPIRSQ